MAWFERARARGRFSNAEVGLWYHPEYVAEALAQTVRVPEVELRRGELIIGRLLQDRVLRPKDVRSAPLATLDELAYFHTAGYLERSSEVEAVARIFGLPESDTPTDQLLLAARRAVGGTLAATRFVAGTPGRIGINLGGGFHHAEPEQGSGFCVFNDVGVAIASLRREGLSGPILIVDLDYHQGNGNTVAYAADPTVHVYSIHGSVWSHLEGSGTEIHLSARVDDARYLACLRTTLEPLWEQFRPRLTFFLAGNDVLVEDRLGTFSLTVGGVFARDRFVVDLARRHNCPLVVTLAGGYSAQAWKASAQLVRYILTDNDTLRQWEPPNISARFQRIFESLDPKQLKGDSGDLFQLTEADVFGDRGAAPPLRRLLGFYSAQGVELGLERYGILPKIRGRGYPETRVEVDLSDPSHQFVRVHGRDPRGVWHLLMEVVLRKMWIAEPWTALGAPIPENTPARSEFLSVEWLLLQDPARDFTLDRPPLPGQAHPGLGVARDMQALFVQMCRRLHLAGVVDHPAQFHNGLGAASHFYFIDPMVQARFLALAEILKDLPIEDASRAVEAQRVRLGDGTVVRWVPDNHVLPLEELWVQYFDSALYRQRVEAALVGFKDAQIHLIGEVSPLRPGAV